MFQNCPIRTKYLFDTVLCYLFFPVRVQTRPKSLMTIRPRFLLMFYFYILNYYTSCNKKITLINRNISTFIRYLTGITYSHKKMKKLIPVLNGANFIQFPHDGFWKFNSSFEALLCFQVNEWLMFNANSAIFQLYHDENMLIFNEMMMRSALF